MVAGNTEKKDATQYLEAQLKAPALGFNLYGHPEAEELYGEIAGWPEIIDIEGMSFALPAGTSFEGEPDPPMSRQSFAARQAVEALDPETWNSPIWTHAPDVAADSDIARKTCQSSPLTHTEVVWPRSNESCLT